MLGSRATDTLSGIGPPTIKAGVIGRIQSMARTHSLLAASRWESVRLHQMIEDELAALKARLAGSKDGSKAAAKPAERE